MKNFSQIIVALSIGVLACNTASYGQKNCPAIPVKSKFDTLGYISANIPTNPANASGKLWLGQGFVNWHGIELRPGFIPDNRPSWAIAIAVAWNYSRNLAQRVEYPQMGYWMGTLIQESQLSCVTTTVWNDPTHSPVAWQLGVGPGDAAGTGSNGGCLQIEGPGSGYGVVQQSNPAGRFPNNLYSTLVQGDDGFEASALIKSYYDAYTSQIYNYNVPGGWDIYKNVDCNQAVDKFSYIKMSGSGYNAGHLGFANNYNVINNTTGCWGGLVGTTANYGNDVASNASVFEQETGYCEYPAGSSFHSHYDKAIPWSEVQKYLDLIAKMYPDVDFAGKVVPEAQAAFIAGAGSIGGTLNFSDFGNVIDAIVLNLPLEKPTPVEGSPGNISLSCPGNLLPYGHADILNGATNMCLGESVTLELAVDAGNSPDVTYKWFKGDAVTGTLIGTDKIITISPTAIGTQVYAGQICNSAGCYTIYSNTQNTCQDPRNLNGFNVVTRDCNTCGFVASASSTKSTCKGMTDGSITINLTNAPPNYTIDITANTTLGSTTSSSTGSAALINIDNIRDGSYNIVLTSTTDPDCKAYTNVIVGFVTAINEYVDAEMVSVSNCVADVKATITKLPAPCNWKVVVHNDVFFQWEKWVNAGVVTSTGISTLAKDTRIAPKPEIDVWNNVPVSEQSFSLNTGDVISFVTAVTTTPGASQIRAYTFNLYDENDKLVYTVISPAGASNNGPSIAGQHTVTCPTTAPDYNFSWNPTVKSLVNTKSTSTGKADQADTDISYVVTATNAANPQCILTDTVIVAGDPACNPIVSCTKPPYSILTPDTVICAGDTAQVRVSLDRTAPYSLYFKVNGLPQVSVTGITDNYYNIPAFIAGTVTIDSLVDATCTNDTIKSLTITANALPAVALGLDTSLCASSYVIDAGRTNISTYLWNEDAGNTGQTNTVNATGEYRVEVASTDGCIARDTVNVTLNPTPVINIGGDTTICAAGLPLAYDATTAGGTYLWSDASTNPTLSATTGGDYWVILTVNGCSDTDSVNVNVNAAGLVALGNDTALCGTTYTIDAGAGFASYSWNESAADINQTLAVSTSGEYRIEVTTAGGCVAKDTINVTLNPYPVVAIGDTIKSCATSFPQTINANPIGGTYLWSDNSIGSTLAVSTQGDYWLKTTVNGCSDSDSVYVQVSTELSLNLTPTDTTVCPGQTITLNPTVTASGVTYTWGGVASGSATSTVIATAGKAWLDIVDAGGCAGTDTMELAINNPLTIDLGGLISQCDGDSSLLELTPARTGLNYTWTGGTSDSTLMIRATGAYTLDVDSAGCTANSTVNATFNALPVVSLGVDTFVCAGAGATITLDAGTNITSYLWDDGSTSMTRSVGAAQVYFIEGTDANGCLGKDTIDVQEKIATPFVLSPNADTTICPAGSAIINVPTFMKTTPSVSWEWANDGTSGISYTVNNQLDGATVLVQLNYTNEFQCASSATFPVKVNNNLSISLADSSKCEGDAIEFKTAYTTAGGYTFAWSGVGVTNAETLSLNNLTAVDAGNVTVNVQSSEGCSGDTTIALTVNALPTPVLVNESLCAGSTTLLNHGATGITVWTFNGAVQGGTTSSITASSGGAYVATVTNSTGCVGTATSVVTSQALPVVSLGSDQEACEGTDVTIGDATLNNAQYTHVWSNAGAGQTDGLITVGTAGTYSLVVTEVSTNCVSLPSEVVVSFTTAPEISIGNDITICIGDTYVIENSNTDPLNGDPIWSNGESGVRIPVSAAGEYKLFITKGSCTVRDSMILTVNDLPVSSLMSDTVLCFEDIIGNSMNLDAGRILGTYLWNTGDTTQTISISERGLYSVTITDLIGCEFTDVVSVQEDCQANVWVPSGFTPDSDGINEVWKVSGRGVAEIEFSIFNRWGELMYEGNSLNDGWDGTYLGNPVGQDVYVWKLTYSYFVSDGGERTRNKVGTLLLAR